MVSFYFLLSLMLVSAVGLLAIPFIKNRAVFSKSFFAVTILIILSSLGLYYFLSDKQALKLWLTQGKQHYQLLLKVDELGGIDNIIERINKKLAANPQDAQGWFILGKLYFAKQDFASALTALTKAHQLNPGNEEITRYYERVISIYP